MSLPNLKVGGEEQAAAAVVDGAAQYVTTTLRANGFSDLEAAAGVPVVWTIQADAESLNGCNNELVIPAFGQQVKLSEGTTTVTFAPEEPGEYSYSCWMVMLRSTITVTLGEETAA